jgi:DNA-binding MarR family transcriptional regulator
VSAERCREAARLFIEVIPAVMQTAASQMRRGEHPMPPAHFRTLMILAHADDLTLTDLAQKQHVSLPTMSNTISVMVEHGLVERLADENDRRRAELRLTAKGSAAVRAMRESVEQLLADRMSGLSAEDVKKLEDGLGVLREVFGVHSLRAIEEGGAA